MPDKMKNVTILVLLIVILLGSYFYYSAWQDAEEKIAKAQNEQAALLKDNDTLTLEVADLEAKQQSLAIQIDAHKSSITELENKIELNKQELLQTNYNTIKQYSDQSIAQQFKDRYKLTDKAIRIIEVPIPVAGSPWKERVLVLPIDYVKLTVTALDSKEACLKQSDLQNQIMALDKTIFELQTQNFKLEQDKRIAYSQGYEKAFAMYLDVNRLYIDLLKNPPKVELAPKWWQVTLGAIGGALICSL